jgi:hypothetical protein
MTVRNTSLMMDRWAATDLYTYFKEAFYAYKDLLSKRFVVLVDTFLHKNLCGQVFFTWKHNTKGPVVSISEKELYGNVKLTLPEF